jgi:hypothetical protein
MARLKDDPIGPATMPKFSGATNAVPAYKPAATQVAPATMPKYAGAAAPQGGFWNQVASPFAKARSGMQAGLNQIVRNQLATNPERSHGKQLSNLINEGWYTPEAEWAIYNTPIQTEVSGIPGRAAFYEGERKVKYPKDYFTDAQGWTADAQKEDLRHEYGHFFDRGLQRSNDPEFQAAAKQTDAEFFPGAFEKPRVEGMNWGGMNEMYADVGRNPYWFRKLSKWYPQYTEQAYNMPAYAGKPGNWINENRTWQFSPTAGRGPYTDIANRDPNKLITMPAPTPIVQASR